MKKVNIFLIISVFLFTIMYLAGCSGNGYIPVPPHSSAAAGTDNSWTYGSNLV